MEPYLSNLSQPRENGELLRVVTPNIWLLSADEMPADPVHD